MTSRNTVRRAISPHMIDKSQCDRAMGALEPVLAAQEYREQHLRAAVAKRTEQAQRAAGAVSAARARIRDLEAEVARLRARSKYATSPECRPDLEPVIRDFERTHRLWPQLPDVRINPIPGPVRRYIHLMAPAITRVSLEQADTQLNHIGGITA
jgi:hypothetical protein